MSWLTDFFVKRLFKGFLDKLPANGKKTILSLAVIALAVASQMYPELGHTFQTVTEYLLSIGADDWRNAGIVAALVSALHKVLKAKYPEE